MLAFSFSYGLDVGFSFLESFRFSLFFLLFPSYCCDFYDISNVLDLYPVKLLTYRVQGETSIPLHAADCHLGLQVGIFDLFYIAYPAVCLACTKEYFDLVELYLRPFQSQPALPIQFFHE